MHKWGETKWQNRMIYVALVFLQLFRLNRRQDLGRDRGTRVMEAELPEAVFSLLERNSAPSLLLMSRY